MAKTADSRNGPYPDLAIDDFMYGHEGPWPQPSRDHPFGQAPGIYNIPQKEWDDWKQYVAKYYLENAAPFGIRSAETAMHATREHAMEYAPLSDEDFNRLMSEGLYSKFLSPLDPREEKLFAAFITDKDRFEYWKSDYSCMRVVRNTHPGEAAAASVALLRRPKNDDGFNYEVVAFQLQHWDQDAKKFVESPIFTKDDGEAWRVGRYFVLQGAIHRINLIDHTEVHFPPDALNAITKTVLPKQNLVLRLLLPHLWLSLPVNNTVLEGQRSLINRNTWYPWSPFVAKGDEVRRLLPFGWYGSDYYAAKNAPDDPAKDPYFDAPNSAYPAYTFDPKPAVLPSRYGVFLNAYLQPVRKFVRGVVEHMSERDWIEVSYWADHIAIWLPGFPAGDALVTIGDGGKRTFAHDLLADALAYVIWNASVRHAADHQTLHEMVDGRQVKQPDGSMKVVVPPMPVPFVMRVKPPLAKDYKLTPTSFDRGDLRITEKFEAFVEYLMHNTPLCWPTDIVHAQWADLLFYVPHNSRRLMDLGVDANGDPEQNYAFDTPALAALVEQFQVDLRGVDEKLKRTPELCFAPLEDIASSIQY